MKVCRTLATLSLGLMMSAPLFAQQTTTNQQDRKETKAELKQQHKADKAHSKADKDEAKAVNTKQAKKAAKAQDKANAVQPQ